MTQLVQSSTESWDQSWGMEPDLLFSNLVLLMDTTWLLGKVRNLEMACLLSSNPFYFSVYLWWPKTPLPEHAHSQNLIVFPSWENTRCNTKKGTKGFLLGIKVSFVQLSFSSLVYSLSVCLSLCCPHYPSLLHVVWVRCAKRSQHTCLCTLLMKRGKPAVLAS